MHLLWLCTTLSVFCWCWWSNGDKMKTASEKKIWKKTFTINSTYTCTFLHILFIFQRDYSPFTTSISSSSSFEEYLPLFNHAHSRLGVGNENAKFIEVVPRKGREREHRKIHNKKNLEMHLKKFLFSMEIPSSELLLLLHRTAC